MNVHFLSKKHDWATPWPLFRELNARFGPCELDVCATARNAKCENFFSPEEDGLRQVWHGVCWMNPPYGRALPHWLAKAVNEIEMERAERGAGSSAPFPSAWPSSKNATTAPGLLACQSKQKRAPDGDS